MKLLTLVVRMAPAPPLNNFHGVVKLKFLRTE